MKDSAWRWVIVVTVVICLQGSTGTGFLPDLFTIGVLKLAHVTQKTSLSTRWCDNVLLCGNSPTRLHIITMETTLNRTFQVIEQALPLDLWILTSTADLDLQPTKLYLQSHNLRFLDYSQRMVPETDADWCLLVLKFAYGASLDHLASRQCAVEAVLDVLERAGLHNAVIVHDDSTDTEVSCLSDRLSIRGGLHVLHNMETDTGGQGVKDSMVDIYWPLENRVLDFLHFTDVLLWCSLPCVREFFREITHEVNKDDLGIQHMTRILIVHPSTTSCTSTNQSNPFATVQSTDNTTTTGTQEACCPARDFGTILSLVQRFYHVAVLWRIQNCVRLQTVMLTSNGSRHLQDAGYRYDHDHMVMTSEVFPNTRWRLNGQKLIVATAIWEPFVMVTWVQGREEYSGLCIDMLKALSNSLNFTYELRQPPDGQYGSIENGSWTGLVRMLKDKKAHLVVAPIAVNELRANVVDFSTPFYQDYTGVLFRRPDPSLHKWKTYFMPFSWQVLLMIAVSFVVGTAFGHVVGVWCLPLVFQMKKPDVCLMDTVQYFFGSLLAQGGVWGPTTGSARMFVSAWWLFCVVLAAIYSGNLTASFAVTNYDPSFTTLEEMLAQDQYEFGTVPGTIWIDIFKFSTRPEFKRIEAKIIQFTHDHAHENINDTNDHIERTMREEYAYVGNTGSLSLTLAEHCNLMILDETFLPLQYAIALQKKSPLTDTVSRWTLQMNEGGLDELWASQWWSTPSQKCGVSKKTVVKIVHLEDCQSAFYILVLGIVVALLAILAENAFHWIRHRKWRTSEREITPGTSEGMGCPCGGDQPAMVSGSRLEDSQSGGEYCCITENGVSRDSDGNAVHNGGGFFERCATNGHCAASLW